MSMRWNLASDLLDECRCRPHAFACGEGCRCVGCGHHPKTSIVCELLRASSWLATRRGSWMGWADLLNLSHEATSAYWDALPVRHNIPLFPLSPIHRWDRLAALNRAARREAT